MISKLNERPVYFPCGDTSLAGVLTVPSESNGRTVLIPWGAGTFPSSGRNQIRTRLARSLAEHGYHVLRFDYRGVGESDGEYHRPDLMHPFADDIVAASDWLTSLGLSRIAVVANCFGGWSSLIAAPRIPGLQGMVVVNAPVWRGHKQIRGSWQWWVHRLRRLNARKLLSADHRARYRKLVASNAGSLVRMGFARKVPGVDQNSQPGRTTFVQTVAYLVSRHIPLLLIYSDSDFRADLESELDQGLRALLDRAGPPTRLVTTSDRLEGFATLSAQEFLRKAVVPWLDEVSDRAPGRGR